MNFPGPKLILTRAQPGTNVDPGAWVHGLAAADEMQPITVDNASMGERVALLVERDEQGLKTTLLERNAAAVVPRKVALLFPGIGEQYPQMISSLYAFLPIYRATLDACFHLLKSDYDIDFFAFTRDGPGGYDEQAAAPEREFGRPCGAAGTCAPGPGSAPDYVKTAVAHPLVFCHELALAEQLRALGVVPDLVAGYSLGEYVAATIAGAYEVERILAWLVFRARAAQELPMRSMLAVSCDWDSFKPLVPPDVHLVSRNSRINTVVAGGSEAVDALRAALLEKSIGAVQVDVNHAFHTPFMKELRIQDGDLRTLEDALPLRVEFLSSTETALLRKGDRIRASYWTEQLFSPIDFQAVAQHIASDAFYCIEVGGGASLSTILKQNSCIKRGSWPFIRALQPGRHNAHGCRAHFLTEIGRLWVDGVIKTENAIKPNDMEHNLSVEFGWRASAK